MSAVKSLRNAILGLALVFLAQSAQAQTAGAQTGLAGLLDEAYEASVLSLFTHIDDSGAIPLGLEEPAGFHASGAIGTALLHELGSFPIGSSSGGFTYFFDPATGVGVRSSQSFGPAFAERPLTSGRRNLNFGMTHQHRRYDQLEGKSLRHGEVKLGDPLVIYVGDSAVPIDIVESTYTVAIDTDTTTMFGTYGVTDRLDVAVAVPFQRVSMDASITTALVKFNAIPAATAVRRHTASGIGDIALRAKYNVVTRSEASVAAGMDVRLPTGDDGNLLGTGNTRVKVYGAAASQMSRILPHVNFGYTFRSEPEDKRFIFGAEVNYTAGAEMVLTPRLTLVGDVIGRSLADEGRLHEESTTVDLTVLNAAGQLATERQTYGGLQLHAGERLNLLLGTLGVKFSPASTFLISAHVLFPLRNAGLQSGFTPVIGVDYTF